MVNLGVDFGSTYTMVAIYENGEPKTKGHNRVPRLQNAAEPSDERGNA